MCVYVCVLARCVYLCVLALCLCVCVLAGCVVRTLSIFVQYGHYHHICSNNLLKADVQCKIAPALGFASDLMAWHVQNLALVVKRN